MKNLNVRLSDQLHTRLKVVAEADNRSLNGEIITLLEHALTCPDGPYWQTRGPNARTAPEEEP